MDDDAAPVPGVDAGGPGVHLLGGEAERLADVAHGRARPVGDDVGHLGRVAAAVALVDVLDDLLAPPRLDVHVDVGRSVTRRREEALEEQPEVDGVDVGDTERVADGRVGRRAAALAVDVEPPAHPRDVPHHEEVAGEAQLADHGELVLDLLPRAGHPLGPGRPVARQRPLGHQLAQVALLVHAGGDGEVGQPRRDQTQVEGAGAPELGRPLDHAGPAGEAPGLLGRRAQAGRRGRGQPALQLGQRAARPHRGERGGEPEPGRRGVVHVVGRHGVDVPLDGQAGQRIVARRVERVPVVPQLQRDVGAPERVDEASHLPGGRPGPGIHQRGGDRPLPAAAQHQPVVPRGAGQRVEGEDRLPLLPTRQVRVGQHGREPRVAVGIPGQQHEVRAGRVGLARARAGRGQRHLGAEDRRQPAHPRRLGEAHHAVEAVMVRQRQRGQPEPVRLGHQLLGVAAAVEEAEPRVGVQLGVGLSHRRPPPTTAPARCRAGAPPVRGDHLQAGPAPAHRPPTFGHRPGAGPAQDREPGTAPDRQPVDPRGEQPAPADLDGPAGVVDHLGAVRDPEHVGRRRWGHLPRPRGTARRRLRLGAPPGQQHRLAGRVAPAPHPAHQHGLHPQAFLHPDEGAGGPGVRLRGAAEEAGLGGRRRDVGTPVGVLAPGHPQPALDGAVAQPGQLPALPPGHRVTGGRVRPEAVRDARRGQRGQLPQGGHPQPLQGDGQVGSGQRGHRPGGEEVRRPAGRDDQLRAGGQHGREEPVGHSDGGLLADDAGQARHHGLLAAEEPGGATGRQRADPEPDRMDPRAERTGPLQHAGEPPGLLPLGPFLEELGAPDDDQPFHHFFSTAPLRPPPARHRGRPPPARAPPLRSAPLRSAPLRSAPLRSAPLRSWRARPPLLRSRPSRRGARASTR